MANRDSFRPDIEGLRGVAALLIVAFHAKVPGFSGGFIGVDVFYALSGYLITGILVREIEGTGGLNLLQFYARRARRLLPASALVLVCTLAAGALVYSPLEQVQFARTARATALYVSNFWFLRDAADYFAPETDANPFLHTWSLAVEEQFYLLWPFLLLAAFRRSRSRRVLIGALGALCVASFALCLWLTKVRQPWAFFSSPSRAWEFALGGLTALLPARPGFALAGIGGIVAGDLYFSAETSFPGWAALLPVLGSCAVLLSGGAGARLLAAGPLPRLGRLSYSWYLWHWPVLLLAGALFPGIGWPGLAVAAVVALGAAELTYRGVENPLRFLPALVSRPRLSLSLAPILALVGLASAYGFLHRAKAEAASPEQVRLTAAAGDRSPLVQRGCMAGFAEAKLRECSFGPNDAKRSFVLFGDSHADQWFPALEKLIGEKNLRVVTLLKSSCPTARVPVYNPRIRRVEGECDVWRESALRRIRDLKPDAVLMSNATGYVRGPGREGGYSILSPEEWRRGLRATLEDLDAEGISVVLFSDSPRAGFDVPTCLARAAGHRGGAESCALSRERSIDRAVAAAETEAVQGLKRVRILDLSESLCRGDRCPAVIDGLVVYSDTNHLTAGFARHLAELVAPVLVKRDN